MRKKKRLIYLCSHFGTTHTIQQLGANFKSKNFEILTWSILPLINNFVYNNFYNKKNDIRKKNKNFVNILTFKQLLQLLKKTEKRSFFINNSHLTLVSTLIDFYMVHIKKVKKVGVISGNSIRFKINFKESMFFLIKKSKLLLLIRTFEYLKNFLKTKILKSLMSTPLIYFVDNQSDYNNLVNQKIDNIYKIDNEDYSKFLDIKNKKKSKKKYIVFLDQDFDHNFDFSMSEKKISNFDPNLYWHKIDNFLKKIDILFNKRYKIVIAAHHRRPRNDYPINRKFIHNKTAELVKNSIIVLGHYSGSSIFPILFKKPFISLDTKDFDLHAFERRACLNFLKKELNLFSINIDKKEKFKKTIKNKLLKINYKLYDKFFENFIGFKVGKSYGEKWSKLELILENKRIKI